MLSGTKGYRLSLFLMVSRFMNQKGIFRRAYFLTITALVRVRGVFRLYMILYPLFGGGSVLTHGAGVHGLASL